MTYTIDATNLFLTAIKAEEELKNSKEVLPESTLINFAFSAAGLLTAIDNLDLRDQYEEYKKAIKK